MSDSPARTHMKCKICDLRKPRRYCPAVLGDICSICCGREREVTLDCPLDCPYLREAHDHEKQPELDLKQIPNQDIKVPEHFALDNPVLTHAVLAMIHMALMDAPGAIDLDLREALEAIIRTLRTRATGLYYDSRPVNPIAAAIFTGILEAVDNFQKHMADEGTRVRDAELLFTFIYVQREEYARYNGRPRCRAFLDILHRMLPGSDAPGAASPLIIA